MEKTPGAPFIGRESQDVLVIAICTDPYSGEVKSFKQYVSALLMATLRNSQQSYDGLFKTIHIDITGFSTFDFTMSHEDRLKLFLMFNYNK